jgi:hypothetical protein
VDLIPTLLQAAGIFVTAVGAAMFHPAIGMVILGVGLLAFGLAMERSR